MRWKKRSPIFFYAQPDHFIKFFEQISSTLTLLGQFNMDHPVREGPYDGILVSFAVHQLSHFYEQVDDILLCIDTFPQRLLYFFEQFVSHISIIASMLPV